MYLLYLGHAPLEFECDVQPIYFNRIVAYSTNPEAGLQVPLIRVVPVSRIPVVLQGYFVGHHLHLKKELSKEARCGNGVHGKTRLTS